MTILALSGGGSERERKALALKSLFVWHWKMLGYVGLALSAQTGGVFVGNCNRK
jgi:hypothetical protein